MIETTNKVEFRYEVNADDFAVKAQKVTSSVTNMSKAVDDVRRKSNLTDTVDTTDRQVAIRKEWRELEQRRKELRENMRAFGEKPEAVAELAANKRRAAALEREDLAIFAKREKEERRANAAEQRRVAAELKKLKQEEAKREKEERRANAAEQRRVAKELKKLKQEEAKIEKEQGRDAARRVSLLQRFMNIAGVGRFGPRSQIGSMLFGGGIGKIGSMLSGGGIGKIGSMLSGGGIGKIESMLSGGGIGKIGLAAVAYLGKKVHDIVSGITEQARQWKDVKNPATSLRREMATYVPPGEAMERTRYSSKAEAARLAMETKLGGKLAGIKEWAAKGFIHYVYGTKALIRTVANAARGEGWNYSEFDKANKRLKAIGSPGGAELRYWMNTEEVRKASDAYMATGEESVGLFATSARGQSVSSQAHTMQSLVDAIKSASDNLGRISKNLSEQSVNKGPL
jgi:hypothetical protein